MVVAAIVRQCIQTDREKAATEEQNKALATAEQQIINDPQRAPQELAERMQRKISVMGRILVLTDEKTAGAFTYALPVSTPWVVSCWPGEIDVNFGPSASVDEAMGDTVSITLTNAPLTGEQCKMLAPVVARIVENTLRAR